MTTALLIGLLLTSVLFVAFAWRLFVKLRCERLGHRWIMIDIGLRCERCHDKLIDGQDL